MTTRVRPVLRPHAARVIPMLAVVGLSAAAAGMPVGIEIEMDDGTRDSGTLVEIGAAAVEIEAADGARRSLPLTRVRTLVRDDAPAAPAAARLRLTLCDGTTLDGDDFSLEGTAARLALATGRAELPIGRVRTLQWRGAGAADRDAWLEAVPEGVSSDLVVVGKSEGVEFVECAITAVGPDTVTVVLDEETIPVKRSKVVGLRWLRPEAVPRGRTVVDVDGGSLRADAVAWTPAGLVLDSDDAERRTSLPAAALRRIDYAAGRTTLLATLPPERLDVEPFFGALGSIDGLSDFFAPRTVPSEVPFGKPGLALRPRTVAVWRIPPQSRRFRAGLARESGTGPTVVTITIDDRRVMEQIVSTAEPVPVDIDVTGGRRLGVTVDFGAGGGMAGAVEFLEPVIEQ